MERIQDDAQSFDLNHHPAHLEMILLCLLVQHMVGNSNSQSFYLFAYLFVCLFIF